ncbi:MAG TPA: hypothetical protein VFW33_24025 [Gemmataceae bacterium]|nr:hypothetical protein [Gemmataceae bacterium]
MDEPILVILGPSGAGKTHFSDYMGAQKGMVHINLDQDGDAALKEGVKAGWEALTTKYLALRGPQQFVEDIRRRISSSGVKGAVVTCTSGVMPSIRPGATGWHFSQEYISSLLDSGVCTVVLYGTQNDCRNSFLQREKQTGRNIGGPEFWQGNNAAWYDPDQFSVQAFGALMVQAFADGIHRDEEALFEEIHKRFIDVPFLRPSR